MIPLRKVTWSVSCSSRFMVSSLTRMKPDARRGIYQTKVSTTPSYRSTRSSN